MKPKDATIAYIGDGNNVANSLILLAAVLGLHLNVATPETHRPSIRILERARRLAAESGAEITLGDDPVEAVTGVNFVYTDTWTSMGQEEEAALRQQDLPRLSGQCRRCCSHHGDDARIMHCLPGSPR